MNKILIYLSVIIALMLTACANEPIIFDNTNEEVLQLELYVEDETRGAKESTVFEDGDAVLVIVRWFDNYEVKYVSSKATYNNEKWIFENPIKLSNLPSEESRLTPSFEAYYPYDAFKQMSYDDLQNRFECENIDITTDYLVGASEEKPYREMGVVKVKMRHCSSRIRLKITNDTNNQIDITTLNFINVWCNYSKDGVNYFSPSWFCRNCIVKCIPFYSLSISNSLGYDDLYKLVDSLNVYDSWNPGETKTIDLFLPITSNSYKIWDENKDNFDGFTGIRFNFFANGVEQVFEFTPNWEEGKSYTYPINLSGENLKKPDKIYLGFDSDDGNKIYWSSVNLGASEENPYGKEFYWGDGTGLRTKEYYYSDYNTWLKEGTLSIEDDLAHAALGGTWRTPSYQDFEKLVDNCTMLKTEESGIEGFQFTSKINGNSIFFPLPPEYSFVRAWENNSYYNYTYNNICAYAIFISDNSINPQESLYTGGYSAFIRPVCE